MAFLGTMSPKHCRPSQAWSLPAQHAKVCQLMMSCQLFCKCANKLTLRGQFWWLIVSHGDVPCISVVGTALLNPKTSISIQNGHPYTGSLNRNVWGSQDDGGQPDFGFCIMCLTQSYRCCLHPFASDTVQKLGVRVSVQTCKDTHCYVLHAWNARCR